jgi:truncated hemoglobin YjbI
MVILTQQGLQEIATTDSRQASLLGQYWTAVERYRDTGDASALREFRGKHIIDATGKRIALLTNLAALDHLGSAGVLSFESMYPKAA